MITRTTVRAASNDTPTKFRGYAAVFNEWTDLYRSNTLIVRETIRPGAFRNALAERQDVRLLFNHDRDYLLARTASGTLRLSEDSRGLKVDADIADTQWNRDRIITPARRGDLDQMSFAFLPRDGGWRETRKPSEGGKVVWEYEITDADLFDVSAVTVPAYPAARFKVLTPSEVQAEVGQFLRDSRMRLKLADMDLRLAELEA